MRNQSIVDDLFNQFGNSPAFEGWYITKEFWDAINVQDSTFTEYYAQLSTYCKSYDTTKSVSIAPAIFLNYPADVYANWINDFLSNCPAIDIVYFQDMGGRLITDADVDLPHYFDLLKTVCEAQGKQFGVDIETFHELNTCDGILYNYRTKTLEELKQQLHTASIFSDEIVNYCWQYFYLYDNQLYTDYKDWVADFSECQEPTLSLNTDIEDLISHIYPNPVSHTLTLQIPELTSEPHSLLVIDISGKVVFEGLLTANRLDVSMLTPGVYLLKIATKENQKYMYRFVKY